ncbi:MAG: hypothetical protein QM758_18760 [Armatimonas sp.]
MKRVSVWASLLFPLLCLFVFWGCGGGGDDSTNPTTKQGHVEGYAYLQSGIVVLTNSATPPAGATMLSGATITVDGKSGSTTTDATGKFLISNVPVGQRKLHVNGTGAPILDVPLTVIGSATIQTGEFPVDRAEARDLVKTAAASLGTVADFQILGTQQPLPTGTVIQPALGNDDGVDDSALTITLDAPHYLFFVDHEPGARFQHPATYYFVNANTGGVAARTASSWPRINEVTYYADDDKNATAQDLIQQGTRKRATSSKGNGSITRAVTTRPRTRDHVPGASDPKTYALLIQGNARSDFAADLVNVQAKLFGTGGLSGNVEISTWKPTGAENKNAKKQILDLFNTICAKARAQDTILIYISSHATRHGVFFVQQGAEEDSSDVRADNIAPEKELDTSKCAACHVIFIMDTCHSGEMMLRITNNPSHAGQKLTILASATAEELSKGVTTTSSYLTLGLVDEGGRFTNAFLESLKTFSDANGGANQGNLLEIFDNAVIEMDSDVQHPQKAFLWDGTACGGTPTLVSVVPVSMVSQHTVGTTSCPQNLGNATLTNVSDKTITYIASVNSSYFNLTGGLTGTLAPGQSKTWAVSFNCGKVPPLEATINVIATVQGESHSQSVTIPITLNKGQ